MKIDSNRRGAVWLLVVLAILLECQQGDGLAVMSIDFGSEWLKIALVKPGVPMEIVLNKESQRKSANMVSLKGDERLFAGPAQTTSVKHPKSVYRFLQHLVGKKYDSPHVELFKKRFPYYDLTRDIVRDTVLFRHNENTTYSVEELLAMIFKNAKTIAEAYADQAVQDCVITVPPFFSQAERRSVLNAAKLGQLKVLQLINDNTAFALNYGVFRRADFNDTPTNILFYDMGSTSTVATLASYQVTKIKERGIGDTVPQLTIKGVGYDSYLGGLDFDLRMRDLLLKKIEDQGKSKSDVTGSRRAMAKLMKEANRIKTVLSANTEHVSQIEGLVNDVDFRAMITRDEFEKECHDLFERVARPLEEALKSSQITMSEVDQVIIVGGGSRIPKVQELLLKTVERSELGKSLNADEAGALGAVYVAAFLSKGFRVKKFAIKDANVFPIQVSFEKEKAEEDGSSTTRRVTRTLFNRNNPFPQKKVMTFNKQNKDFTLTLDYGATDFLSRQQIDFLGCLNLSKLSFSGVESAMGKHDSEGVESKGIKAHFELDGSGIVKIEKVEAVFEKPPEPEPEEESTFAKLGNTISSFFGSSSKEEKEKKEEGETKSTAEEEVNGEEGERSGEEEEEGAKTTSAAAEKDESEKETKSESSEEEKKDEEDDDGGKEQPGEKVEETIPEDKNGTKEEEEAGSAGQNDTSKAVNASEVPSDAKNETSSSTKSSSQPKPTVIRESIDVSWEVIDLGDMLDEAFLESEKKLRELDRRDEEKLKREQAVNTLESFIYETRDALEGDAVQLASTEEEREKISEALAQASDWLYEDGMDASTRAYEDKLDDLKAISKPVFYRAKERSVLPTAVFDLKKSLNLSTVFLSKASNLSEYDQIYTDTELRTLGEVINETTNWLHKMELKHNATSPKDDPVLRLTDVHDKGVKLDREVMYLINKAKWAKPLKKRNESEAASTKNETTIDEKATNETRAETDAESDAEKTGKGGEDENGNEKPVDLPEVVGEGEKDDSETGDVPESKKNRESEEDFSKETHDEGEL